MRTAILLYIWLIDQSLKSYDLKFDNPEGYEPLSEYVSYTQMMLLRSTMCTKN